MIQSNYFTNIQLQNVPCDKPMVQPQQFNQAPVTFNNLPIHHELVNLQNSFIVNILNSSASKASQTPGRMYQWNLFCQNGGQNKELMDTVVLAINYTALGMAKNSYSSIEQAATASIQFMVEARAAYIVAIFPDLMKMYPPQNQQSIANMAQQYVNVVNEVTGYINSVVFRNVNGGQGFGGGGNFGQQAQQPNMGFGNNNSGFGSGFSAPNNVSSGFGTTGRSMGNSSFGGGFGVNNGNNQRQVTGQSPFTSNRQQEQSKGFATPGVLSTGKAESKGNVDVRGIINLLTPHEKTNLAKKHEADLQKQQEMEKQPAQTITQHHVEPAQVFSQRIDPVPQSTWKPTQEQIFVPACPGGTRRKLVNKNGKLIYELELKSQEEIKMEREAHRTTTAVAINRGTAMKVEGKAINSRGDFLKVSLDTVANTHDAAFNATDEKFNENLNAYFLGGYSLMEESETSLDAAINKARQMKVLTSDLNQLGAHRIDFDLDQMFVIPKTEYEEFEKILRVTNLDQLAAKLKAGLLDDQRSLAFNSALIQLDSYIKHKLMAVVRNELGLTVYDGVATFVDDYEDLIEDIRVLYANQHAIFKKHERAFIARFLTLSDTAEAVGNGESTLINAVIKIRSSVTVVDFLYQELDVDLIPNQSNVVIRDQFPKIYEFLDELVSNDYIKNGDIYYANHWLVTADNEIIRIYRSQLDNATILMAKV